PFLLLHFDDLHLPADLVGVPTGQLGEVRRFLQLTVVDRLPILVFGAADLSLEWISKHVAGLEVLAIACRLEHEVIGKMRAVVADVQTADENVDRTAITASIEPEHAELAQLVA